MKIDLLFRFSDELIISPAESKSILNQFSFRLNETKDHQAEIRILGVFLRKPLPADAI